MASSLREASRSHPVRHVTHSLGVLWTSDQFDAETCTEEHNSQISMRPAGFETALLTTERPQTQALDRAATVRYWARNIYGQVRGLFDRASSS